MIILLIIQFISSLWMTAVIWFVQIVHYPLFKEFPREYLSSYAGKHQQWISLIVVSAMLLEFFTLLGLGMKYYNHGLWITAGICLLIIWVSTFFVQVPIHVQFLKNPSHELVKKLVNGNWIRTIFWTIKTILLGWLMMNSFKIN